jgi:hypothetical protein
MRISKLWWWVLEQIAKRIVIQGFRHSLNIERYYVIMYKAARKEFNEDYEEEFENFIQARFTNARTHAIEELNMEYRRGQCYD